MIMLRVVGFTVVLASRGGLQSFYRPPSARIRRRDVPAAVRLLTAPRSGRVYGLPAKPLLEIHDAV